MSQLELCPAVGCRVTAAALYVVVSCGVGPSQLRCLSSYIGHRAVLQSSLSCMGLCGPAARTGGIFAQLLGVFDESCGLTKWWKIKSLSLLVLKTVFLNLSVRTFLVFNYCEGVKPAVRGKISVSICGEASTVLTCSLSIFCDKIIDKS